MVVQRLKVVVCEEGETHHRGTTILVPLDSALGCPLRSSPRRSNVDVDAREGRQIAAAAADDARTAPRLLERGAEALRSLALIVFVAMAAVVAAAIEAAAEAEEGVFHAVERDRREAEEG